MALIEKECLAPKLSRPKCALANHSGIGGRWPKTGGMDIAFDMRYTQNSKRVTGIDEGDG